MISGKGFSGRSSECSERISHLVDGRSRVGRGDKSPEELPSGVAGL